MSDATDPEASHKFNRLSLQNEAQRARVRLQTASRQERVACTYALKETLAALKESKAETESPEYLDRTIAAARAYLGRYRHGSDSNA
jgi:hypothetical protein